jgi:hypothetical protein
MGYGGDVTTNETELSSTFDRSSALLKWILWVFFSIIHQYRNDTYCLRIKLLSYMLFATCVIVLAKLKSSCFVPIISKSFYPFLVGTDASKLPVAIIYLK